MIRLRKFGNGVKLGDKFFRLKVVGQQFRLHYESKSRSTTPKWAVVVKCDCGLYKVVCVGDLIRSFQKSCGCYRDHVSKENGKANTRHGETGTPLHNLWHLMKQRCYDSNQRSYPNYGGRGIKVYRKWKNNYELFRDYALAQGYKPGLQIDRYPDNNGNYRPGNIRFVTCKVNQRN